MRVLPGPVSYLSGSHLSRILGRTMALCLRYMSDAYEADG